MKSSDIFASKYLKVDDLRGRDVTVVIDSVEIAQMPNGGQKKPAVYFRGKEKALVLNKTNFNTIVQVTGKDDTDDWKGESITLYPSETEFGGEMVDCIRVRRKKAPAAQEWQEPPVRQTVPADDDLGEDIPF